MTSNVKRPKCCYFALKKKKKRCQLEKCRNIEMTLKKNNIRKKPKKKERKEKYVKKCSFHYHLCYLFIINIIGFISCEMEVVIR